MTAKKRVSATLTTAQQLRAAEVIKSAMERFSGNFDELESAVGMYMVGHYVGWKVLVLVHSKRTVRKYEEILQIIIREEFPEEGLEATRSLALTIAKTVSNFWKVVSGEDKTIAKEDRKQFG